MMITFFRVACDICDGHGGILANVKPDDPDYYIFSDGKIGIKCPKCEGSGRLTYYEIEGKYVSPLASPSLFFDVVKDEMKERNWTYYELTYYSGCLMYDLFRLLHKRQALNDELANGLAKAFGTTIELWWGLWNDTTDKETTE